MPVCKLEHSKNVCAPQITPTIYTFHRATNGNEPSYDIYGQTESIDIKAAVYGERPLHKVFHLLFKKKPIQFSVHAS